MKLDMGRAACRPPGFQPRWGGHTGSGCGGESPAAGGTEARSEPFAQARLRRQEFRAGAGRRWLMLPGLPIRLRRARLERLQDRTSVRFSR